MEVSRALKFKLAEAALAAKSVSTSSPSFCFADMTIDGNERTVKQMLSTSSKSLSSTSSNPCSDYELINEHKTVKYVKESLLILKTENTIIFAEISKQE